MNKRNYIVIAMVVFAFTACRETPNGDKPGGTMNGTTPSGDTTTSNNDKKPTDDIVTYTQGDMDQIGFMNQDMSQTYSELEMSDEQIKSYESSMGGKQIKEANGSQDDQRDNAMKSILTDVQYGKYEMMKENTSDDGDQ